MTRSSDGFVLGSPDGANGASASALDALFTRVYDELRRLAHQVRGGRAGATLDTTALVHEAYLKLLPSVGTAWESRAHFFGAAARAMRQILVDAARRQLAGKRGGARVALSFDESLHPAPIRAAELLALDEAIEKLRAFNLRGAQVVEYRFFAGLSTRETAELLGVSTGTVEREWYAARAWLALQLAEGGATEGTP
jgi:RNA polymerase sigma factor (TIGR02999 family)